MSHVDRELWENFRTDPETVGFECEVATARVLHKKPETSDAVPWEDVEGLDRNAVTKLRVNQAFFRRTVIAAYRGECCVCAIPIPALLVAAHIVPWSVDRSLRMNPHNGLCLCALHDRAYDKGLLRIGRDYAIGVPRHVKKLANNLAVTRGLIDFEGLCIKLPDRWQPDVSLLERHEKFVPHSYDLTRPMCDRAHREMPGSTICASGPMPVAAVFPSAVRRPALGPAMCVG